ncbi:MAG TPA: hypothetical protein PLH94_10015 [Fimbriimonadaceae bacterium]|nr:hypothetical protein [Fimbriimonadaceae bacterium]
MKRTLSIAVILGGAAIAMAFTASSKVFNDLYKVKPDSKLGKAGCAVCHATAKGGKLNAYGADIDVLLRAAKRKRVTVDDLKAVENKDSDGDGMKNIDEIKADRNPGVKG